MDSAYAGARAGYVRASVYFPIFDDKLLPKLESKASPRKLIVDGVAAPIDGIIYRVDVFLTNFELLIKRVEH